MNVELQPRKQRDDVSDIFVNLLATQEDHTEVRRIKNGLPESDEEDRQEIEKT